jgi:carbonic anhydrase
VGRVIDRGAFDDILAGNEEFAARFEGRGLPHIAARGLAVVTCMDSRIEPLHALGMRAGDAKILRNAGARVTDDVLRTLVLAVYALGVNRVLVMPHTQCRMASATEPEIHELIAARGGLDSRSLDFLTTDDQYAALRHDLVKLRAWPYLPEDVAIGGAIYDVATGLLEPVPLEPRR